MIQGPRVLHPTMEKSCTRHERTLTMVLLLFCNVALFNLFQNLVKSRLSTTDKYKGKFLKSAQLVSKCLSYFLRENGIAGPPKDSK